MSFPPDHEHLPAAPMPSPASGPTPRLGDADAPVLPSGELAYHELSFRLGLLVGALLFFQTAMGWPWQHNLFGIAGFLLAVLVGATLVIQWRVLGDWRRRTQQIVYTALLLVLSLPLSAALSPRLQGSALPEAFQQFHASVLAALEMVPGASTVMLMLRGILTFTILCGTLLLLLLGSGAGRRAGVYILAAMVGGMCLFFYPSVETLAGFILLGLFFVVQWEVPLIIPDRVRDHLEPTQRDFLRVLQSQGSLTTAETKLYLDNRAELFGELLEFRLVQYDTIAREVLPGPKLLHDPASNAVADIFAAARRTAWILVGLLYFILPDLIPGPIDDIIVLAICAGSGFRLFDLLRPAVGRRRPMP